MGPRNCADTIERFSCPEDDDRDAAHRRVAEKVAAARSRIGAVDETDARPHPADRVLCRFGWSSEFDVVAKRLDKSAEECSGDGIPGEDENESVMFAWASVCWHRNPSEETTRLPQTIHHPRLTTPRVGVRFSALNCETAPSIPAPRLTVLQ